MRCCCYTRVKANKAKGTKVGVELSTRLNCTINIKKTDLPPAKEERERERERLRLRLSVFQSLL